MSDRIQSVGVIGAGQMGRGITMVSALGGLDVTLMDVSQDALSQAFDAMSGYFARRVESSKLSQEDADGALQRIRKVSSLSDLCDLDLVIEAVTENETVKCSIFKDLCPHLHSRTILASNTSSISITRLAAATDRPDKFLGIHFMNPVMVMELVEIIRGIATSDATFAVSKAYVSRLGKVVALSEDYPAFIVNRILIPMINEAIYALYEGVGTIEAIDTSLELGANHPMGPLKLADFIGLDTCLSIMQVLYDGLSDTKYRPCPLLVKYVEAGWLGCKSGRGFYDYSVDPAVPTR